MTKASAQEPATIAPINSLPSGTRLHEYEIRSVIGEGGFGIVYLAYDTILGREVAIKEYLPISHAMRRDGQPVEARTPAKRELFEKGMQSFVSEARILAKFKHRALVEILRFWEDNGTAYMVMPYYHGKTLRDMVRSGYRAKTVDNLFAVLIPLLEGLSQMHAVKCYHRDISSDNILILENNTPVLLDFGAARHALVNQDDPTTIILKPGFAPIEQYSNEDDALEQGPWTDVYALSAVAYQLVSGNMPTMSVARIVRDPLKSLTDFASEYLPAAVLKVIESGLAVKPQDRPQTIEAFENALMNAAQSAGKIVEESPEEDAISVSRVTAQPVVNNWHSAEKADIPEGEGKISAPHSAKPLSNVALWGGLTALLVIGSAFLLFGSSKEASNNDNTVNPVVSDVYVEPATDQNPAIASGLSALQSEYALSENEESNTSVGQEENSTEFSPLPADAVEMAEVDISLPESVETADIQTENGTESFDAENSEIENVADVSIQNVDLTQTTLSDTPQTGDNLTMTDEVGSASGDQAEQSLDSEHSLAFQQEDKKIDFTSGKIEITVKPWGNVYLNGEFVGTVPPRLRLDVPVGINSIEIRNESSSPFVQELNIKGGKVVRISHDFSQHSTEQVRQIISPSSDIDEAHVSPENDDASVSPDGSR